MAFDTGSSTWSMYFDGSDVGLRTSDVDAFYLHSDNSILLSLSTPKSVAGIGKVDDSDIIKFIPSSLGENTAGSFELFFDGSDVDLVAGEEDVDAIGFAPDGRLILSTSGPFSVSGASGQDEDLIAFTPTSLGGSTSGTWAMYFDGSDITLTSPSEDVWGTGIDSDSGDIYLTTKDGFSVSSTSGDGADIFVCSPASLGSSTSCSSFDLFFDGSSNGMSREAVDSLSIGR